MQDEIQQKILRHASYFGRPKGEQPPRLATIAKWFNGRFPHLEAKLVESYSSTDYHYKHSRLRRPGKGRSGKLLIISNRQTGEQLFRHDSSQTYRQNSEVANWIAWNLLREEYNAYRAKLEQEDD